MKDLMLFDISSLFKWYPFFRGLRRMYGIPRLMFSFSQDISQYIYNVGYKEPLVERVCVLGLVDTNINSSLSMVPIIGNDDTRTSIYYYHKVLAQYCFIGRYRRFCRF